MQRHRFSLFGHVLVTAEDFSHSLTAAQPGCNNSIEFIVKRRHKAPDLPNRVKLFPPKISSSQHTASLYLFRGENVLRITYLDLVTYDMFTDRIVCYPAAGTSDKRLHLNFLGPLMSMWLEQRGFQVLHASAVLIHDNAVLFLADSQQGKSTIASAMVNMGYPLLSDDLVPVKYSQARGRFYAYPSYPVIKLWPEQFERLFKNQNPVQFRDDDLKKCRLRIDQMNPNSFCNRPCPLAVIYKLNRCETTMKISIEKQSRMDSVTDLVRYSFAAPVMIATGWQPHRLSEFSKLSSDISVRNLKYSSGKDNMDSVCREIMRDCTPDM